MQNKLTIFDLNLVPSYKVQYLLGKSLYFTFTDAYPFADVAELEYEPRKNYKKYKEQEWQDMVSKHPQKYRRQGISTGNIDKLADALIKSESQSNETIKRVLTFSEFEEKYVTKERIILPPFEEIFEIFKNFHPKDMPILWLILLVQAHIYEAMKKTRDLPKSETVFKVLCIMSEEERKQYDWPTQSDQVTDNEVFNNEVIQEYILSKDNLKDFWAVNNDETNAKASSHL